MVLMFAGQRQMFFVGQPTVIFQEDIAMSYRYRYHYIYRPSDNKRSEPERRATAAMSELMHTVLFAFLVALFLFVLIRVSVWQQ